MPVARRTRKRPVASGSLDELTTLVASLIKENQKLKRQLARLEAKADGTAGNSAAKGLRTLARKVERALDSTGTAAQRNRRTSTTAVGRSRRSGAAGTKSPKPVVVRKPASLETQAKRLAALARAREARAAKKAAIA
jgi:phosphate uptake regulator